MKLGWREVLVEGRGLLSIGLAFMCATLVSLGSLISSGS